jgi:hypothetical protein
MVPVPLAPGLHHLYSQRPTCFKNNSLPNPRPNPVLYSLSIPHALFQNCTPHAWGEAHINFICTGTCLLLSPLSFEGCLKPISLGVSIVQLRRPSLRNICQHPHQTVKTCTTTALDRTPLKSRKLLLASESAFKERCLYSVRFIYS